MIIIIIIKKAAVIIGRPYRPLPPLGGQCRGIFSLCLVHPHALSYLCILGDVPGSSPQPPLPHITNHPINNAIHNRRHHWPRHATHAGSEWDDIVLVSC